jgi:GNAT superfamily N-acetyltransferase
MNNYHQILKSGIVITSLRAEHARQLERLQHIVFPTLAPELLFRAEHYLKHLDIFPEGQFVALHGEQVVGATSTVRLHYSHGHDKHPSFAEIIQGGWLTSHQANGDWLYGADVSVHPHFRRMGIARGLYKARQDLVHRLGLRGQIAGGMLSGYGAVKHKMTAIQYFEALLMEKIVDPTLSAQRKVGFELRELLPNYLDDPVCDNYGVLIVLDAGRQVALD